MKLEDANTKMKNELTTSDYFTNLCDKVSKNLHQNKKIEKKEFDKIIIQKIKYIIKNKNPYKKIKTFSIYKLNNLKVGNQDYLFEQNGFTINKIRKCLDLLVFNKS